MRRETAKQTDTVALACQGLTKRFGGLEAVKDVNLSIAMGERRAIIGPNGAGKTTFFGLISGLIPVSEGSIRIFNTDITNQPSYRRTSLGLAGHFRSPIFFQA